MRKTTPRKNAVGITSYILDGLCGGLPPYFERYTGSDIKPRRNVLIGTRNNKTDPILFGIAVDNALARRIDRGVVSANPEISARVEKIVGLCTREKVHLIAAQVKMPVHTENGVRLRTELDAIGFKRATANTPAAAVVIELKTCNRVPAEFTHRIRGAQSVGYRHVVQVGFGMHCVKRMLDERGVDLNVRGLLLYSTESRCSEKWIELNNDVVARRTQGLFAHPIVSAGQRRRLEFKKTTWRRVKMPEWPTGLRGAAIRAALRRVPALQEFAGADNIKGTKDTEVDVNVSAVLRLNEQHLFVCLITGRDAGTKKRTRIGEAFSLIKGTGNNIKFAIVRQARGGWEAEEVETPQLLA